MIGFGNPLLDGNPKDADDAAGAKLARAKQRCPDTIRSAPPLALVAAWRVSRPAETSPT